MYFVNNEGVTDPRINLAIEEYLLRQVLGGDPVGDGPILLFYINEPAVIIGRNQNALEEIDPDYVKSKGIHLVRRLSGGGAVYHDLGNLNFSFITPGNHNLHNFALFTKPVIHTLQELGVAAELHGKSDIFVAGKKISGNAQYSAAKGMFSHGTLLFNTDLTELLKAINPRRQKIESKAVQSIRNFVTNINELLPQPMTIDQLREALLVGIFGDLEQVTYYRLSREDWTAIHQLAANKYQLWDWNVGRSPKFNVQNSQQLSVGKVDVRIEVSEGHIQAMKIYGDFSGAADIVQLEEYLSGVRYEKDVLLERLANLDISRYFGELDPQLFLNLIY